MIAGIIHYRQLPTRSEDAYSMQASPWWWWAGRRGRQAGGSGAGVQQ